MSKKRKTARTAAACICMKASLFRKQEPTNGVRHCGSRATGGCYPDELVHTSQWQTAPCAWPMPTQDNETTVEHGVVMADADGCLGLWICCFGNNARFYYVRVKGVARHRMFRVPLLCWNIVVLVEMPRVRGSRGMSPANLKHMFTPGVSDLKAFVSMRCCSGQAKRF